MRGKPAAITTEWAQTPQCWLDVETTGLGPDARVVQVAAVRTECGAVVERRATYVDPCVPIPREATRVHGIDDRAVRGAPMWVDVLGSAWLSAILEDAQVCAYGADFDSAFFPRRRLGAAPAVLDDDKWPWFDGLVWARELEVVTGNVPPRSSKLAEVCERWGIPIAKAHDALADAEAAALLAYQQLTEGPLRWGTGSMVRVLALQRKLAAEHWFERELRHAPDY